jgi:hypothetical protein
MWIRNHERRHKEGAKYLPAEYPTLLKSTITQHSFIATLAQLLNHSHSFIINAFASWFQCNISSHFFCYHPLTSPSVASLHSLQPPSSALSKGWCTPPHLSTPKGQLSIWSQHQSQPQLHQSPQVVHTRQPVQFPRAIHTHPAAQFLQATLFHRAFQGAMLPSEYVLIPTHSLTSSDRVKGVRLVPSPRDARTCMRYLRSA